ncbi:DUF4402 domain-containing protein [Massilia sp. 9I]|uniref:DUF4402 domain-containing protein n=1 Tax=Massilia sp. 9I TaxID=2653152 RepID=UPI0012F31C08|nr:DUF4402 domain-containing protein [Massilia sp. 9I]VXC56006.1 conserved exported hypothetical protein [Massilia sp. 9I]
MTKHARFTKTHLTLAALALAMSAAAGSAIAAQANATSTSTVVTPIAISKANDLGFGTFAAGASIGTVTVSTNGTRSKTGGVTLLTGGTVGAAKFDVTGSGTMTYSISWAGSSTTLVSGTDNMTFTRVADLTGGGAVTGDVSSGALTAGAQSIYVGGVLDVAINQPAGSYSGTISATVEYN